MKKLLKNRLSFVIIAAFLSVFTWLVVNYQFVINHSESLPISWVLIKKNKLPSAVDDIFVFWVKDNPFYKNKDIKFIKLVGGLPGDKVETKGGDIYFGNKILSYNVDRNFHKEVFNAAHLMKLTDPQEFKKRKIKIIDKEVYVANHLIGVAKPYTKKFENFVLKNIEKTDKSEKYDFKYDLNVIDAVIIPSHKFFAYTPHVDSFDSRYKEIGLIDEKNIIGTAVFVW